MDVKTLLLLGAGMVVLSLVGFCSVQSRSAGLAVTETQAAALEVRPGRTAAWHGRAHKANGNGYFATTRVSAAPAGANR